MPYYDYLCDSCGSFTESRPMAESAAPRPCPACGASAPRAILTAPHMGAMSKERRMAFATNERSANAPRLSSAGHGAGCSCCAGMSRKSGAATAAAPSAAKSFPAARPWMISH
jgi:putative FmdB family regulatory protein|nr:zinc ribbon domain-containing protein [Methylocella tundrae]